MVPPIAAPAASCSTLRRRRPAFLSTREMRGEVELILKELKQSCRSPLFDQIEANNIYTVGRYAVRDEGQRNSSGGDDTGSAASVPIGGGRSPSKRLKRDEQQHRGGPTKKRWDELLSEAAILLPFMTVEEHGILFRVVSILFLGYISPSSTGNDFFTLQDYYYRTVGLAKQQQQQPPHRQTPGSNPFEGSSSSTDEMEVFISMPLEERLEGTTRYYAADEYGEVDVCYDERLEDAFQKFLWKGLAPMLAGRAAHGEETDLIHLMAMVICPHPVAWKEERETDSWKKAKQLMKSIHSACFHVHYQHRQQLVQLVMEYLVLPEVDSSSPLVSSSLSPLMTGALPHLLAALHGFALGALSPRDAHWAYCGCVNTVIQTGHEKYVQKEWDALLKRTLQDKSAYGCSCCSANPPKSIQNGFSRAGTLAKQTNSLFCAHAARGELLQLFISRYNGSRHYADEDFTRNALTSLTDAIKSQLDPLMKTAHDKNGKKKSRDPSCKLASLIHAAKTLFFFLLPLPVEDETEADDGSHASDEKLKQAEEQEKRDQLLACAVQCLKHKDSIVAHASASLLVTAFAYGPETYTDEHVLQACSSVAWAIRNCQSDGESMVQLITAMQPIVATAARLSKVAASSLLMYLVSEIKDKDKESKIVDSLLRLVSAVAVAEPRAASTQINALQSLSKIKMGTCGRTHLAAAFLSCRWGHFFAKEEMVPKYLSMARDAVAELSDSWIKYKLAMHAMLTSNFSFSKELYTDIMASSSTDESYLWISALVKVCEAEETLSASGACGIPAATPLLYSALTHLRSLSSFKRTESTEVFGFQMEFLKLRLDLLDLCSAMRNLGSEMRLTGIVPRTNTRSGLHIKNMANCFTLLATRCYKIYQRFGLLHCQSTRTSLRTFHALCRFLSRTASKVFAVKLPSKKKVEQVVVIKGPQGDALHPMTMLMNKLDEAVVQPMDEAVDPVVRATALTEIIDGILMAPVPFPRGFTVVKQLPIASLRLSGDPENAKTSFADPTVPPDTGNTDAEEEISRKEVDVLEVLPYHSFAVYASGTIPKSYFDMANLSFSNAMASYKISYDSPLHPDEEFLVEEDQLDQGSVSSESHFKRRPDDEIATVSCPLFPNGNFLFHIESRLYEEGFYKVDVQLGCRDLRCGEWEIPVAEGSQTLFVRVSRTRD